MKEKTLKIKCDVNKLDNYTINYITNKIRDLYKYDEYFCYILEDNCKLIFQYCYDFFYLTYEKNKTYIHFPSKDYGDTEIEFFEKITDKSKLEQLNNLICTISLQCLLDTYFEVNTYGMSIQFNK